VDGASLSTRLCAICLGAALVFAQLLCAVHQAAAVAHQPDQACDLCLGAANVDHALIDADTPLPAHGRALQHHPAGRTPLVAGIRELRARSPPR
jgi:hypothetical protein